MDFSAAATFGPDPAAMQPTSSPQPDHLGGPEPMARTTPAKASTPAESPALAIVVLIGLAVVILQLISR